MNYYNRYVEFLKPEKRISSSLIRPLNIYRITTYAGGDPPTKVGLNYRYVFATGIWEYKLHCFQFNEINPVYFIDFLNKIIDKRKTIGPTTELKDIVKKFPLSGKPLFEAYLKRSPRIYGTGLRNYRTYFIKEIKYAYLVQFEQAVLMDIFKLTNTQSNRRVILSEDETQDD
jgi:hypothetical protein